MTGRNNKKKRMRVTATTLLLLGAAAFMAVPASGLGLVGSGSGQADAVWGAYSEITNPGGEAEQDVAGSAHSEASGSSSADVDPPDPQPVIDAATALAAEAQAQAEAAANAVADQKGKLAADGGATWALHGDGSGSYDVVLGGHYDGGAHGTAALDGSKEIKQSVNVKAAEGAASGAQAQAQGALDGAVSTLEGLWSKLHMSLYLGLDGAARALGSFGMDIAGLFGFNQAAELVNTDTMHLGQRVDVAAPALPKLKAQLPAVDVPDLTIDQGGQVAADAAAVAEGAVGGR